MSKSKNKTTANETSETCLNPSHADRKAACRGLCTTCYTAARKLVSEGKTSWEDLVAAGKAKEPNRGRQRGTGANQKWLLGSE